jgi:hypothetical protein
MDKSLTVGRIELGNNDRDRIPISGDPKSVKLNFKADNTEIKEFLEKVLSLDLPGLRERILDFLNMGGNLVEVDLVDRATFRAGDLRVRLKPSNAFLQLIATIAAREGKDLVSINDVCHKNTSV